MNLRSNKFRIPALIIACIMIVGCLTPMRLPFIIAWQGVALAVFLSIFSFRSWLFRIVVILGGTMLLTGGVYIENWQRHLPLTKPNIMEGPTIPYVTFDTEIKTTPIIPPLLYVKHNKSNHHIQVFPKNSFLAEAPSFDGIKITSYVLEFDDGSIKTVIPSNDKMYYYGITTRGRKQWFIPTAETMATKAFPVCPKKDHDCYGWFGPVSFINDSPVKISLKGAYLKADGGEVPFKFEQKWALHPTVRFNTGWGMMP